MLEIKINATITIDEKEDSLIDSVFSLIKDFNATKETVQTESKECCK